MILNFNISQAVHSCYSSVSSSRFFLPCLICILPFCLYLFSEIQLGVPWNTLHIWFSMFISSIPLNINLQAVRHNTGGVGVLFRRQYCGGRDHVGMVPTEFLRTCPLISLDHWENPSCYLSFISHHLPYFITQIDVTSSFMVYIRLT